MAVLNINFLVRTVFSGLSPLVVGDVARAIAKSDDLGSVLVS
jgi:hypothetical protein